MDERTIVYVAAVLDSAAVIRTREASGVTYPYLALSGSNTPLLRLLGGLSGMRVVVTKRSYAKAGCAEHCKEKHLHVTSESGRWSVSGAKATVILAAVLPYLRLQVDDARAALLVGLRAPFKPATLRQMERLGWPIPEFDNTKE